MPFDFDSATNKTTPICFWCLSIFEHFSIQQEWICPVMPSSFSPSDSFNAQAVHWARSKAQAHESSMQRQSCDLCVIFLSKWTNWTQNTQGYLRQDMFAHFSGGYTREPPVYSFSAFPFSLPLWTASQDSTAPSFSDCQILSIEHDNV